MFSEVSDPPGQTAIDSKSFRRPSPIEISSADFATLNDLKWKGRALEMWRIAQTLGPLQKWHGTRARLLAGWLTNSLGAGKLSRTLYSLAWRQDKKDGEASASQAYGLLHDRGPLAAWKFLNRLSGTTAHDAEAEAYLHTVRALTASHFRDFEAAELWLARAEKSDADKSWIAATRAYILEREDRYAEALESAQASLRFRPHYRAGIHAVVHCLRLLNRDEEAEAVLIEGAAANELGSLHVELARLQIELGKFDAAQISLDRYVAVSPLIEKGFLEWVQSQRLRIACRNNLEAARTLIVDFKDPYHAELKQRLEQLVVPTRRVQLNVHFVRQHHATCAPATLAALSQFWNKPCQHTELAEEICYDGTPAHSERNWAITHDWFAREFTVTRAVAVALLDRGIPFTLTTSEATNAHLQAVIGYDELRDTFLIRDPYLYCDTEFGITQLLERYRSTGPRGMVMVPVERRELLDGVELPDSDLYDRYFELLAALHQHDRAAATKVLEQMEGQAPDHRLTLAAIRTLSAYDGNTPANLKVIEQLLEKFPKDGHLTLSRLGCLRELGRRVERLELLEVTCADKTSDPTFYSQYTHELREDAREHDRAAYFCDRALRYRPTDAANLATCADLMWDRRHFAEALEFYRLAACLEDKKESFSRNYFIAARHLRETERALGMLRTRFDRFASRSSLPAITLFEALEQLDRLPEAFTVLESALTKRPNDGSLILFAAEVNGRYARSDEGMSQLEKARPVTGRSAWLRCAARLAALRNDRMAALEHWKELVQFEPTSGQGHRHIAQLLAETEGRAAALKHLRDVCEKFPHNFPLGQLRLEWLRDEDGKELEQAAQALAAIHSTNAWMQRELALALGRQNRWPEALAAAEEGVLLEPDSSSSFSVRGALRRDAGKVATAIEDFRHAIEISVDNGIAIDSLLSLAATLDDKRKQLQFIQEQLEKQVVFGEGLLAFRDSARGILTSAELMTCLKAALDARPDLWQAWSALIEQMIESRDLESANAKAREATARFPLLPRLWLDQARACRAASNKTGELEALEKAVTISAYWSVAARQLAAAYTRASNFEKACHTLERACTAAPLDADNHADLSRALWSLNRREDALRELKLAIEMNPGIDWLWDLLGEWATELNQPGLPLQMARELVARRGGESRSWIILARMMHTREKLDDVLATLDTAIARNPQSTGAFDFRAEVLALAGRKDEALMACCNPVWDGQPPIELQARAAWIEWRFGQTEAALQQMQQLLKNHPNYYHGWKTLVDWLWEMGQEEPALDALEQMAKLAPFDPVPWGYRAAIKLRRDDSASAKEDLERALRLSPAYEYAANNLFEIYLKQNDFTEAERILEIIRLHQPGDRAIAFQLKLQSKRGTTTTGTRLVPRTVPTKSTEPPPLPASRNWLVGEQLNAAIQSLRTLCVSKEENGTPLEEVYQLLMEGGVVGEVDAVLDEMIDRPEAHPHVGILWVRRQVAKKRWELRDKLLLLHERGEIGRRAIIIYASNLGDAARKEPLLALLKEHGDWLAKDNWGWETVAIALGACSEYQRLLDWAKDWRSRAHVDPAVLHYLLIALHQKGRYAEATQLAYTGSERAVPGKGYESILVWAATEHAIANELTPAKAALGKINADALSDYHHRIHRLARAMVEMQSSTLSTRKQAWKKASELVDRAIEKINVAKSDKAFRRAFWKCNVSLARDGHRPWRVVWAGSKVYSEKIALGVVIAFLAIVLIAVIAESSGGAAASASTTTFIALIFIFRMLLQRK